MLTNAASSIAGHLFTSGTDSPLKIIFTLLVF